MIFLVTHMNSRKCLNSFFLYFFIFYNSFPQYMLLTQAEKNFWKCFLIPAGGSAAGGDRESHC